MSNTMKVNIGNSGEYFVAGELERRGFTVAVPMSNVKDFDILAINRETYEQFAIQVKTTGYKQKRWTLSKKNEDLKGRNIFYVFVSLNELETPEYHIVPSEVVADTIKLSYQDWINTPGKKGQKHNDTSIRVFFDKEDKYLNRWDLLEMKLIDDRNFQKGIYYPVISFLPRFKEVRYDKKHIKCHCDDLKDGEYERFVHSYETVLYEFEKAVYTFEEEHPEFRLNDYNSILLLEGIDWEIESMSKADISRMRGQTVMALILGAIRAERFCDGALSNFFESGCIERWLLRLDEIEKTL